MLTAVNGIIWAECGRCGLSRLAKGRAVADLELRRAEFVRHASSKHSRVSEWSARCPCEWRPQTVIDLRTGQVFTDAGAWDFVVENLNSGCQLEEVILDKPPGKTAYVLKLDGGPQRPFIYVKLQAGSGKVIGRSFHYDSYDRLGGRWQP